MNFLKRRFSRHEQYGLSFTLCVIASVLFLIFFASVLEDVIGQDPIVQMDVRVMHLFAARRVAASAGPLLFITYLGNWQFILPAATIITIMLFLLRKRRMALFFATALLTGQAISSLVKFLVHRSRPDPAFALISQGGYSFPSGHALIAPIFWGLIGYFIFRTFRRKSLKTLVAAATLLIIVLIGVSRIYLGVHWTSDVLAGWALGCAVLFFTIALFHDREEFYPRAAKKPVMPVRTIALAATLIFLAGGAYLYAAYKRTPIRSSEQPEPTTINITSGTLEELVARDDFPKYSESITSGRKTGPVSLIVVGSKEDIIRTFSAAGWFRADPPNPKTVYQIIRSAILGKSYPTAPVAPSSLNGLPETIAFEQATDKNKVNERHHTRFWPSGFSFNNGLIWVATASFDNSLRYVVGHTIDPNIDKERNYIAESLKSTGSVATSLIIQLGPAQSGSNFMRDTFYTDGKAYLLTLASTTVIAPATPPTP